MLCSVGRGVRPAVSRLVLRANPGFFDYRDGDRQCYTRVKLQDGMSFFAGCDVDGDRHRTASGRVNQGPALKYSPNRRPIFVWKLVRQAGSTKPLSTSPFN